MSYLEVSPLEEFQMLSPNEVPPQWIVNGKDSPHEYVSTKLESLPYRDRQYFIIKAINHLDNVGIHVTDIGLMDLAEKMYQTKK